MKEREHHGNHEHHGHREHHGGLVHHPSHRRRFGIMKSKITAMRLDTKRGALIIAAVVLVAVIVLIYALSSQKTSNEQRGLRFTKIDPSALPPGAPLGAVTAAGLPPSFPKGLAIDPNAVMTVLNGLPFTTSTAPKAHPANEYTLAWVSTSSPSALFTSYENYFNKNRWAIANKSSTATTPYFDATMASSTALVVLIPGANNNTRIVVDYTSP